MAGTARYTAILDANVMFPVKVVNKPPKLIRPKAKTLNKPLLFDKIHIELYKNTNFVLFYVYA
jgi:hypothetical protein